MRSLLDTLILSFLLQLAIPDVSTSSDLNEFSEKLIYGASNFIIENKRVHANAIIDGIPYTITIHQPFRSLIELRAAHPYCCRIFGSRNAEEAFEFCKGWFRSSSQAGYVTIRYLTQEYYQNHQLVVDMEIPINCDGTISNPDGE